MKDYIMKKLLNVTFVLAFILIACSKSETHEAPNKMQSEMTTGSVSESTEIATLAYIVIEILIVASLMIGRPGWFYMLFFYFSAAAIVLIMAAFPFDESSVFQRTVRNAYPMILFLFLYKAVGPQIFLVFDQPFDPQVHGLELSMLGLDPAFYLQKYVEIWVNELMGFAYFSYYISYRVFYFLNPS